MLLIGFGIFLIRDLAGARSGEPLSPLLLGFHVVLMIGIVRYVLVQFVAVNASVVGTHLINTLRREVSRSQAARPVPPPETARRRRPWVRSTWPSTACSNARARSS